MVRRVLEPASRVRIAVVGKYTELTDAYTSIREALIHGASRRRGGGFGMGLERSVHRRRSGRGASWRVMTVFWFPADLACAVSKAWCAAIRWAREHQLPFFGICLGLQTAIIEFARNVCRLPETNSSEFEAECEHPVISLMHSQREVQDLGGTMRLGAYPCKLRPGSRAAQIYSAERSE